MSAWRTPRTGAGRLVDQSRQTSEGFGWMGRTRRGSGTWIPTWVASQQWQQGWRVVWHRYLLLPHVLSLSEGWRETLLKQILMSMSSGCSWLRNQQHVRRPVKIFSLSQGTRWYSVLLTSPKPHLQVERGSEFVGTACYNWSQLCGGVWEQRWCHAAPRALLPWSAESLYKTPKC